MGCDQIPESYDDLSLKKGDLSLGLDLPYLSCFTPTF